MCLDAILISALSAGDGPSFCGSNSDGHAAGPATPVESSDAKNVVRKTSIPRRSWSSSVIVDGQVFATIAVRRGEGLSLRATAFDAKTGKVVWDREVRAVEKAPSIHAKDTPVRPTRPVRDGSVFVHFGA